MTNVYEDHPVDDAVALVENPDSLVARVRLRGEIDLLNAGLLRAALESGLRNHRYVVIDAAECTFMDSTGLHAMLVVARSAPPDAISVHNPSPAVRRLLRLTRVDSVLNVDG